MKMGAWMLLFFNLIPLQLQMVAVASVDSVPTPKLGFTNSLEGCNNKCGNVDIPYPFGIGTNCSHNHFFDITCNTSFHPPKPFLSILNIEVIDLTEDFYNHHLITVYYPPANVCSNGLEKPLISLSGASSKSPYRFPHNLNNFLVNGCYASGAIMSRKEEVLSKCTPFCNKGKSASSMCQAIIPYLEDAMDSYQFRLTLSNNRAAHDGDHVCLLMAVGRPDIDGFNSSYPPAAAIQWTDKDLNKADHTNCTTTDDHIGHCRCADGYVGNPYLPNGCQDPEECRQCKGTCVAYNFSYAGDWNPYAFEVQYRCETKPLTPRTLASGLFGGLGSVSVLFVGCLLYKTLKRIKEKRRKAKNFKRNGGLLLQQQIASIEHGFVEKTMIFTRKELDKATDNFNKNRILGRGGQGTVYKGMLADGRIVAIKKATIVDGKQSQEFINEVFILSQINHRNVVKLLGCCLETDVPLLVYEYVPNGTLSQHIHDPREDFHVTWQMRLQIASETAGALAYLHSSSSAPIFHRDIKSNNILLDEKYRAKVADFGISRTISTDQTHLTTNVVGTFGYLDPEYFRSFQFTEKSDVYSFGVVLLELLTGKKALQATESDEYKSLTEEFLLFVKCSKVVDILDPFIVEDSKEEFLAVANLATRCLNMVGSNRPTMKEVAMTLEGIRSKQPWSLGRMCQEIEYGTSEVEKPHNYKAIVRSSSCISSFFVDV